MVPSLDDVLAAGLMRREAASAEAPSLISLDDDLAALSQPVDDVASLLAGMTIAPLHVDSSNQVVNLKGKQTKKNLSVNRHSLFFPPTHAITHSLNHSPSGR
jgi:hypothetical protein